MEPQEHSNQYSDNAIEHKSDLDYYVFGKGILVIFRFIVVVFVEHPVNGIEPRICHCEHYEVCDDENVDEE